MKRTIVTTIKYWWSPVAGGECKLEHVEALAEAAEDHISEMSAQGYTSGELYDNIYMTDDDPENGIDYRGWWEIETQINGE
jgi:hypothetical protein